MIDRPQSLNHVIPGAAASRADPGSKGVDCSVWGPNKRFALSGLSGLETAFLGVVVVVVVVVVVIISSAWRPREVPLQLFPVFIFARRAIG